MRMYRVIYDAIDEIEAAMKGMLAPKFQRGRASATPRSARPTRSPLSAPSPAATSTTARSSATAQVARACATASSSTRASSASLQRFKDSVKEVAAGYECGMTIEKFNDIKEGDVVEAYVMEQIEQ